jgi:hypothetical protein
LRGTTVLEELQRLRNICIFSAGTLPPEGADDEAQELELGGDPSARKRRYRARLERKLPQTFDTSAHDRNNVRYNFDTTSKHIRAESSEKAHSRTHTHTHIQTHRKTGAIWPRTSTTAPVQNTHKSRSVAMMAILAIDEALRVIDECHHARLGEPHASEVVLRRLAWPRCAHEGCAERFRREKNGTRTHANKHTHTLKLTSNIRPREWHARLRTC